jgi:hypothetical protein
MTGARKMRQSAQPLEMVEYVVDIIDWYWAYSLSLISEKYRDDDPYREFRHLKIVGKLLQPTGFKTEVVHISLLPSSGMSEERRKNSSPTTLGTFELRSDIIEGLISIPADVLPPILQMLIAKKFKFIHLTGSKFYRRSARLTGLRLEMHLPDDALVDAIL